MKIFIETEKESGKLPKKPFITVAICNRDFIYDAHNRGALIIPDEVLNHNMKNHMTISAYKSEKQCRRFNKRDKGTSRNVLNIIFIILTVIALIASAGIFFAYIGEKNKHSGLTFSYSFSYEQTKDLKITIYKKHIITEYVETIM